MTLGYQTNLSDTYNPWAITIDGATENSVAVGVKTLGFQSHNTALQLTLSPGGGYTWSGHGIPGNVWVSASVFISSTDPDNSDHFNVHIGLASSAASSWGETYPASVPPYGVTPFTHEGDAQGVYLGHYGTWRSGMFKTAGDGKIYVLVAGMGPSGTGLRIQVHGYQ